jgi:phage gp36-like protein
MNYCSVEDVRYALAADGATQGTNTAADMDDATIADAIAEASSVVDTYVGGPYAQGDSVPDMVIYWTRDVAAFLATCTYRRSKDFQSLDPVLLRYQFAISRLAGVFTGTTAMPGDQMPTADTFDGAVYNLYPGQLIWPYQFDLFGNSVSTSGATMTGWPYRYQWPGYMY